jgi:hypothetical protein
MAIFLPYAEFGRYKISLQGIRQLVKFVFFDQVFDDYVELLSFGLNSHQGYPWDHSKDGSPRQ